MSRAATGLRSFAKTSQPIRAAGIAWSASDAALETTPPGYGLLLRLFRVRYERGERRAFRPAVEACRIVPGALPLSAGVVGAIATFKAQMLGDL